MKYALMVCLLVLAGCARQDPVPGSQRLGDNWNSGYVSEIKLQDGTRCVIYAGYQRGGLSCDWK